MIYNATLDANYPVINSFIIYNGLSFFMILCVHRSLLLFNKEAIWFQLHSVINCVIALCTYSDVFECLNDPSSSNEELSFYIAPCMVLMLHLYHALYFELRTADWLHHIGSCFFCTPMALNYPKKGFAFYCFFCSGFPGAIDYALLALYKNKYCPKIVEKKANAYLNSYIRIPGGVIGSYLIYKDSFYMETSALHYSNIILSFLIYVNTCYYGKEAIENYGVWKNNHKKIK
jgi:hypothetical protein